MGGLIELLGIKRGTDAEGDALAEEHVVGDGGDAAVVDLGLFGRVSTRLHTVCWQRENIP